jgi:hypothetical protein
MLTRRRSAMNGRAVARSHQCRLSVLAATIFFLASGANADLVTEDLPAEIIRGRDLAGLSALTAEADTIAFGVALSRAFEWPLLVNGHVQQRLKFRVEACYKGSLVHGAVVTIGRWGGSYVSSDGRVHKSVPPRGTMQVESNRQYLLFMRRAPALNGFDIVGGPQGTFEIRGAVVLALDQRHERTPWLDVRGLTLSRFVDRIHAELKK